MHSFPHHYAVTASNRGESDITLSSEALPSLQSAAPVEFDGPGGRWSPETLVVAAVADCFMLTFRTMARMSKLEWTVLECRVNGTVDRVHHVVQFTAFQVLARLTLPAAASGSPASPGSAGSPSGPSRADEKATRLLHKAHGGCLVSNSLKAETHFEAEVVRGQ